jgi:hypothetical protein
MSYQTDLIKIKKMKFLNVISIMIITRELNEKNNINF